MKKIYKMIGIILITILVLFIGFLFVGWAPKAQNITWGVNFSQMHTENLKLDWKKTYLALMDDLGAKNIKLIIDWDWINGEKGEYYFNDVDWQIKQAEQRNVNIMMVIGMKTARWPECHIPVWAKGLSDQNRNMAVLEYLKQMVLRYGSSKAITSWQVENEPFFPFGECPVITADMVKKEVALVKSLDPQKRPIIVSDTGEFSLWFKVAGIGDIVGDTMYRKVWSSPFRIYFNTHFPAVFYWRKAQLVNWLFGKKVECVELQAEPWGPVLLYDLSLEDQKKSMDIEQFKSNIEYAKNTGLDTFYFWGNEWWYWMKEKQNDPSFWNEAKKVFNTENIK